MICEVPFVYVPNLIAKVSDLVEKHRQYAKKYINLKSVVSFNTLSDLRHKQDSRGTK